jgi:hypothetical protein
MLDLRKTQNFYTPNEMRRAKIQKDISYNWNHTTLGKIMQENPDNV